MNNCTDKKCFIPDKNHICFRNAQGQLHRDDGPALEHNNGYQSWYLNDERVS